MRLLSDKEQAHTKANMEIALATKKDGSQMKSIAILTMIFLPATFVAVRRRYLERLCIC